MYNYWFILYFLNFIHTCNHLKFIIEAQKNKLIVPKS